MALHDDGRIGRADAARCGRQQKRDEEYADRAAKRARYGAHADPAPHVLH
jgi:hypothetical protein